MKVKCLADQNRFWKVIHNMIVKDSKWEGFVPKCIKPTVAPTVISLLLWSLVTSYISSNSQSFQELKLEISKEEEKILYYMQAILYFPCWSNTENWKNIRKNIILPLLQYSFVNHWGFLVIIRLIQKILRHMFKNGFVKLIVEVLLK